MRIAIMIEGKTEKVFLPTLRNYLEKYLSERMPRLDLVPYDGRIPKGDKLQRDVQRLLSVRHCGADAVIALTDVYTGGQQPDFSDAAEAKAKMRHWVGEEPRFFPHAAQFDFEAWLLPYWGELQQLAGHNMAAPGSDPEKVNHMNPPSKRIHELFRRGSKGRSYVKVRDAGRILRDVDLSVAIEQCKELKALVNTILSLSGAEILT